MQMIKYAITHSLWIFFSAVALFSCNPHSGPVSADSESPVHALPKTVSSHPMVRIGEDSIVFSVQPSGASTLQVAVLTPFYIDATEITQAEYASIMGENPSWFSGDFLRPVERVEWIDAVLYCNARSLRDGYDTVYEYSVPNPSGKDIVTNRDSNGYRLPTEAEWEYACAGDVPDSCRYWWCSGDPDEFAWYGVHSTKPVAAKQPNSFGMYDMSGNVAEWCNDAYDTLYFRNAVSDTLVDPSNVFAGERRVVKGGHFYNLPEVLAFRNRMPNKMRSMFVGFRCVRKALD